MEGGRTITASAPIETMPLYVRVREASCRWDRSCNTPRKNRRTQSNCVSTGEQTGRSRCTRMRATAYDYEKGVYATIPISWNDKAGALTIGERKGTFPGMLRQRTFRVVWVSPGKGTGLEISRSADQVVSYCR